MGLSHNKPKTGSASIKWERPRSPRSKNLEVVAFAG
jgi:hypothetical protein